MNQLDDHTRRMLLAVDDPPIGMQDRIYRAIVTVGGPPDGGDPGGGLTSSGGGAMDIGFAAKVVGATIGMTSAGVALLALTSMGIRAMNEDAPTKDRVVVDDRSPATSKDPGTETQPDPIEPANTSVAVEPTPTTPERESSTTTAPSEPAEPGSTLEAELALIQAAKDAKSDEDRLALLEQHRDEFADGVLADEREVMRIGSLCALGRVDEAEQAAASFVSTKPAHPLRSRVEPACRD